MMQEHTGRSAHPKTSVCVELVAYERRDGGWDAFLFEPAGVCPPEWEEFRVDRDHVFLGRLADVAEFDGVAAKVAKSLGPAYERVLAFREEKAGDSRRCKRALHLLHKRGCTGYAMKRGADGRDEVWARRRDLPLLEGLR